MQELLSKLLKSQRDRLDVHRKTLDELYYLKLHNPEKYDEKHATRIEGRILELEICSMQIINLYNLAKDDSKSSSPF